MKAFNSSLNAFIFCTDKEKSVNLLIEKFMPESVIETHRFRTTGTDF